MGGRLSTSSLKARADQTRQRIEAHRQVSSLVDAAFVSIRIHSRSGGGLLAGAIAFRFFMFLIPCVFVFVIGLGVGADISGESVRDVAKAMGIAGVAATAIQSSADAPDVTRWLTFAVSVIALVLGARNLLRAIWVANALIWRLRLRKPRYPTLGALVLIAGLLVVSLSLRVLDALRELSFLGWVVGLVAYTLVPAGLWLLCSVKAFRRPLTATWRDMVPGAALFGLGTQGLHVATILWVAPSMSSKSQTYGAIGAALTILLWAYLLGRLVTSAVALNAAAWRSSHPRGEVSPTDVAMDGTPTAAAPSSPRRDDVQPPTAAQDLPRTGSAGTRARALWR